MSDWNFFKSKSVRRTRNTRGGEYLIQADKSESDHRVEPVITKLAAETKPKKRGRSESGIR